MRAVSHPTFPDQQALPIAALGHGFSEELLRDVLGGITSPGATMDELETCRWVAAVTELDSLNPRTQMEAMLAGQAVVCHHAAMDCFRRANRLDQPDDMAMRLRKTASMMMRSMSDTLRALERLQSRPVPVREPDASEEIIPPATDTDAPERAFASLMPREPKKMDDAFVRERIARARKIIAEERGFTDDLPVEDDPFSPEALLAQLRATRQKT